MISKPFNSSLLPFLSHSPSPTQHFFLSHASLSVSFYSLSPEDDRKSIETGCELTSFVFLQFNSNLFNFVIKLKNFELLSYYIVIFYLSKSSCSFYDLFWISIDLSWNVLFIFDIILMGGYFGFLCVYNFSTLKLFTFKLSAVTLYTIQYFSGGRKFLSLFHVMDCVLKPLMSFMFAGDHTFWT